MPWRSTALLTDHYELTMVDAALASRIANRPAVFETFARSLPASRRYGVLAGVERVVDALRDFHFGSDELDWLADRRILRDEALEYLADYRFTGDITAYREGELYFPNSPVLTVVAPFAEAVVLETVLLSILNYDSAIASAAARMVQAAGGRPLLEFGSRRAHEEAAVAAARAAYIVGFAGTSNLEAGRRYGVPTLGTAAHAYTMIHDDEAEAFRVQVDALGRDTTLLVDTYDIPAGIRNAVAAGGPSLGSIRIDSGDLHEEAIRARKQLDELGAHGTQIVGSGDLDEYRIEALNDAPYDSYGVGTRVVTGSGHSTAGFVYKLVARGTPDGFEPVSKSAGAKSTVGIRKAAFRVREGGHAVEERLVEWGHDHGDGDLRPLQVTLVEGGRIAPRPTLDQLRLHHEQAISELSPEARALEDGAPAIPTVRLLPPGAQQR